MRRFMAGTLAGFLARDYAKVAQMHYDVAFVPPQHPIETFAQALRAIGEPIFGKSARDVSIARLLGQLFETTRRFDMQAQPQLVLLQKTMVVVEGVARGLDPDFDIWEAARPVAERWVRDNLGPEARLARAAEGFSALGKLAQDLPQLVKNAEEPVPDGGGRRRAAASRHRPRRSPANRSAAAGPGASRWSRLLALIAVVLLARWTESYLTRDSKTKRVVSSTAATNRPKARPSQMPKPLQSQAKAQQQARSARRPANRTRPRSTSARARPSGRAATARRSPAMPSASWKAAATCRKVTASASTSAIGRHIRQPQAGDGARKQQQQHRGGAHEQRRRCRWR